jgi:hypothetical protein
MKDLDKVCHIIKEISAKDREAYARREENHIVGTPKIIIGKQL